MIKWLRIFVLTVFVLFLLALGGLMTLILLENRHWVLIRMPELILPKEFALNFLSLETPLAFLVLVSFFSGVLLTSFFGVPAAIRRAIAKKRMKKQIAYLEGEVKKLRNLPLEATFPTSLESNQKASEGIHLS